MTKQWLKLKQASAVLQIDPKELQNLVQFGVVMPKQREGTYFFDLDVLLAAKIAFSLKEYLGTRTNILSKFMAVFLSSEKELRLKNPKYIFFECRSSAGEDPIKLGVPFRAIGKQIEERMNWVGLFKDLPPGRKRRGWKNDFVESLTEAAKDIGKISEEEILRAVRSYRKERSAPEIAIATGS